jgi:hypothetical protein
MAVEIIHGWYDGIMFSDTEVYYSKSGMVASYAIRLYMILYIDLLHRSPAQSKRYVVIKAYLLKLKVLLFAMDQTLMIYLTMWGMATAVTGYTCCGSRLSDSKTKVITTL